MHPLAMAEAAPTRRRHVGFDFVAHLHGPADDLAVELRRRLDPTHLRLERVVPGPDRTFACRLLLADAEAHMTPAAALEALATLDGWTWTSLQVLEEIDGQPAFEELA